MFGGLLALLMAMQGVSSDRWFVERGALVPDDVLTAHMQSFVPSAGCCRPRGGCRSNEVTIMIPGVPEAPASGTHAWAEPGILPVLPARELWLAVIPLDHFTREMVMDGEWAETRPRLRGPH
jgi:hypothetical protein